MITKNTYSLQKLNPIVRSPFFYVGDKYKLMGQLRGLMPANINTYVDAFAGGGSAFLNIKANKYLVNDIDKNLIELHKTISSYADREEALLSKIHKIIADYNLSCSFEGKTASRELRIEYPKTYFAKYNKAAYVKLRDDFNNDRDMIKLYILLIYGFNRMIRFNKSGNFNLPVGNVDFNKNVAQALNNYLEFMDKNHVEFSSMDYAKFIKSQKLDESDFVYIDPPYLISASEYNKLWSSEREVEMYTLLDQLDANGVRFGLSNLVEHKGAVNHILKEWSSKYKTHTIRSNYISFNDNSIKQSSKEIYVTNYE